MRSLLSQAFAAGDEAMRRRQSGPPRTLAGRLRSAIEDNDSLELMVVLRSAKLNRNRGSTYASLGRAARAALLGARAKEHGHEALASSLQQAAMRLLVGV